MWNSIKVYVLSKLFRDGFKEAEKLNLITKAFDICYKNVELRRVWTTFVNSVISFLEDAIDEAKQVREWSDNA